MMINVSSIFSGVNDLFKFLFLAGLFLVVFSLVYPIEKEKELKLAVVEYNGEIAELNAKDQRTLDAIAKARDLIRFYQDSAKSLLDSGQTVQAYQLKAIVDSQYAAAKRLEMSGDEFRRAVDVNNQKIDVLEDYASVYSSYTSFMFIVGVVIGTIGLIFWGIPQYHMIVGKNLDNKVKRKELNTP